MTHHLLAALCVLSAAAWAWTLYAAARTMLAVPRMVDDRSPAPARWPRVSLVIAACNEERELERAVRTRLADDYPDLQVVLVEDRSTDRTPEIADALAREDPRVRVVHLTELPAGWLGKLHAMHRGAAEADGEWLLFSDADVEFAPGTLRRAVAYCERHGRDHLAVLPLFREHGPGIDATLDVFCRVLVAGGRLWSVGDPRSTAAVGGGMFNLVRREAFDRTPGFEWLRMEIADDVVLGQMLKRHGARPAVLNAVGAVSLDFYRDLGEMAHGMEKSGFAIIGRFRLALLALVCAAGLAADLGFAAGFLHPAPWVRGLALATALGSALGSAALARWLGRAALPALLYPFGQLAMVWMAFRSAWLARKRGGVAWRGTLYPVEALREGSRFSVF